MDVMGGIADYSGSLVLQMPIQENTVVRFTPREDFLYSVQSTVEGECLKAEIDLRELANETNLETERIRNFFLTRNLKWAAYVIGCALLLQKEKGIRLGGGVFHITSTVPIGKGVSSSASLEVATLQALAKAHSISFQGTELAVLAQQVENLLVGAPCGLMDQLACSLGRPGYLLPIICQPDLVETQVPIPEGIYFVGIDSGVKHAVSDDAYGDVRCSAYMGYSIIADSLGIHAPEKWYRKDLPFGGYLANIPVEQYERQFMRLIPETMLGEAFLKKYGDTIDPVTSVDPAKIYQLPYAVSHPIYENARVTAFRQLLLAYAKKEEVGILKAMGLLMQQAHVSYSRCGLGSDRTDEIQYLSRTAFSEGIYGAKITGGGSGGTVCLLCKGESGLQSARKLHQFVSEKYQQQLKYIVP
jgi:L-arabinokinase